MLRLSRDRLAGHKVAMDGRDGGTYSTDAVFGVGNALVPTAAPERHII